MTIFDYLDKHPYGALLALAMVFVMWCATVEEIALAIKSRK